MIVDKKMSLSSLTPEQVAEKVKQGAILVDIRSNDEYLRKHIQGAVSLPLNEFSHHQPLSKDSVVIFHCLSGMRTRQNADFLKQYAKDCSAVYLLEGGLNAWQKAGLPIEAKAGVTLDIMRQVQLVAGGLILFGVMLGAVVSPWFYGLAGFVGAGLMFAGLTGFCGMARLLAVMPWNRF